jgi:hypothetical protein
MSLKFPKIGFIVLFVVSLAFFFPVSVSALWNSEIVNPATGYYGKTSLALDSDGMPQIAFITGPGSILSPGYAKKSSAGWTVETLPYAGYIVDPSLDLDSHNIPHISFYDQPGPSHLEYAVRETSGWKITTVDGEGASSNEGATGNYDSLKIDSLDNVHISYESNAINSMDLKYASLTGGTWSSTKPETSGVVGAYTSLALDSRNHPHISHTGMGYGEDIFRDMFLLYTTLGSGSEVVDSKPTLKWVDGFSYTSLAMDSNDRPHISYLEGNYTDTQSQHWYLKYATKDSTGWHVEFLESSGTISGPTSIAVDSQGNPWIAYYDAVQDQIKVAEKSGGAWNIVVVDEGSVQGMPSLGLSSANVPHISYVKDKQLKYASTSGSSLPRVESTITQISAAAGGTALAGSGGIYTRHSIVIPPGSLENDMDIVIAMPGEDHGLMSAVEISPTTTFSIPATITVEYKDSDIPQGQSENAMRLLVWDGTKWTEVPGSTVNTAENVVSGHVSHLSTYAAGIAGSTPVPEFPSAFLPAAMIIGFLGAVLLIQRTREN